ncbi:MAG: hypothetical protein RIC57_09035 [Balneola sp.]
MYYLKIVLLISVLSACKPDLDQYLVDSHVRICSNFISIGTHINSLNDQISIQYKERLDGYMITCEDGGAMFLGSGHENSEIIIIKDIFIQADEDSSIYVLAGSWLNDYGGSTNDFNKVKTNLEKNFRSADAMDPLKWRAETRSLSYFELKQSTYTIKEVEIKLID